MEQVPDRKGWEKWVRDLQAQGWEEWKRGREQYQTIHYVANLHEMIERCRVLRRFRKITKMIVTGDLFRETVHESVRRREHLAPVNLSFLTQRTTVFGIPVFEVDYIEHVESENEYFATPEHRPLPYVEQWLPRNRTESCCWVFADWLDERGEYEQAEACRRALAEQPTDNLLELNVRLRLAGFGSVEHEPGESQQQQQND